MLKKCGTKKLGFTLIELLAVIIIVSILANVAIVSFVRMAEKARMRDAEAKLSMIYQAERTYNLDNASFGTKANLVPSQMPEPNTTDFPFTFTMSAGPPYTGYTATATRQGSGRWAAQTVSISNTSTNSTTYAYSGSAGPPPTGYYNGLPN